MSRPPKPLKLSRNPIGAGDITAVPIPRLVRGAPQGSGKALSSATRRRRGGTRHDHTLGPSRRISTSRAVARDLPQPSVTKDDRRRRASPAAVTPRDARLLNEGGTRGK